MWVLADCQDDRPELRRASLAALTRWASHYGQTVTSKPGTDSDGTALVRYSLLVPNREGVHVRGDAPTSRPSRPPADTQVPGLGDGHPPARPARSVPYLAKDKETFGMPNATSTLPGGVFLDWRRGYIGDLAPCVVCGEPGPVPVPGPGQALPQGLR